MAASQLTSLLFRLVVAVAVVLAPAVATAQNAVQAESATAVPSTAPRAIDVELHPEGLLVGQLVSASGAPSTEQAVTLKLADGRQAVAKTNAQGGFAFRGVRGAATLESEKAIASVRAWAPGSAPPSATPALLMVEDQGVARGQHYAGARAQGFVGHSKKLLANPLFVAGVIATAVAVPLAIADDDDGPAS